MSFEQGFKRGAGEASGKVLVYFLIVVVAIGVVGGGGYFYFQHKKQQTKDAIMRPIEAAKEKVEIAKEKTGAGIAVVKETAKETFDKAKEKTAPIVDKAKNWWLKDKPQETPKQE